MPAPELDSRHQKAQYWKYHSVDNYNRPRVYERCEIMVRWENKQLEIVGPNAEPIKLDGFVHSVIEIPIGSILWKGCAADIPEDTEDITNLMEVVAQDHTPDIKGRVARRWYGLRRFTSKLPEILS